MCRTPLPLLDLMKVSVGSYDGLCQELEDITAYERERNVVIIETHYAHKILKLCKNELTTKVLKIIIELMLIVMLILSS